MTARMPGPPNWVGGWSPSCPVTSNVTRVLPFQVLLPADRTGLRVDSKAQAEQVRSVDVTRLSVRIARVPPGLVNELDEALRLHLDL